MFDESNEELGYVSSTRPFNGLVKTTNPDEEDIPALTRVLEAINEKIALRNSNDSLNPRDSDLSVKQQLFINQQVVAELREMRMIIETAIIQAREDS